MESGEKFPSFKFDDFSGQKHSVSEFDQKCHVGLICCGAEELDDINQLQKNLDKRKSLWDWLGAKIFVVPHPGPEGTKGIYLIDRFGYFIDKLPMSEAMWDQIEKEFLYYDARHC